MPWLSLLIQLPVFFVLGWLFARGRPARYAGPVLVGCLIMAVAATAAGFQLADRSHGGMWPQVLAAVSGYGVFLTTLFLAWWLPRLARPR